MKLINNYVVDVLVILLVIICKKKKKNPLKSETFKTNV